MNDVTTITSLSTTIKQKTRFKDQFLQQSWNWSKTGLNLIFLFFRSQVRVVLGIPTVKRDHQVQLNRKIVIVTILKIFQNLKLAVICYCCKQSLKWPDPTHHPGLDFFAQKYIISAAITSATATLFWLLPTFWYNQILTFLYIIGPYLLFFKY